MQSIIDKKRLMERVHHLIRRSATGSPKELAERLAVSQATLFRLIEIMKDMGAPIVYDLYRGTYRYEFPVDLHFGFERENLTAIDGKDINGGLWLGPSKSLVETFLSLSIFESDKL